VCLAENREQHMWRAIPISQWQNILLQVTFRLSRVPLQCQGSCCEEAWQGARASNHSGHRQGAGPDQAFVVDTNRHDCEQGRSNHRKLVRGERCRS
jgi:hypothetical protein